MDEMGLLGGVDVGRWINEEHSQCSLKPSYFPEERDLQFP